MWCKMWITARISGGSGGWVLMWARSLLTTRLKEERAPPRLVLRLREAPHAPVVPVTLPRPGRQPPHELHVRHPPPFFLPVLTEGQRLRSVPSPLPRSQPLRSQPPRSLRPLRSRPLRRPLRSRLPHPGGRLRRLLVAARPHLPLVECPHPRPRPRLPPRSLAGAPEAPEGVLCCLALRASKRVV
jgi:hypothetical protein